MFFHAPIIALTLANADFRQEIFTAKHAQIVLMSLKPKESIGKESHDVDQILMFTEGSGKAIINGKTFKVKAGDIVFVPAHATHNFINTGRKKLKLFTVYAPPEHKPGTVHTTKQEAEHEEHT